MNVIAKMKDGREVKFPAMNLQNFKRINADKIESIAPEVVEVQAEEVDLITPGLIAEEPKEVQAEELPKPAKTPARKPINRK